MAELFCSIDFLTLVRLCRCYPFCYVIYNIVTDMPVEACLICWGWAFGTHQSKTTPM